MKVIWGLQSQEARNQPTVLTVGNFDGMHLGHQELVKRVVTRAREKKVQAGLMTFDPHPMKVLAPQRHLSNLFDLEDRIERAAQLGLDFVVVEPFSRQLSDLSPEAFFEQLLIDKLKTNSLFVGHDFNFGKNRSGTLDVLKDLCEKKNVALTVVPPVKVEGEIISSTGIRNFVSEGLMDKTKASLGRPFYLKGVVEKGAGRGKKIGFPTANLFTSAELLPRMGIYVTTFQRQEKIYHSVTNVGQNPTFTEKTRHPIQVETYILDFDRDIYGEAVKVNFLHYLRPELKFSSVEELIEAIKKDVKMAEAYPWESNS